MKIVAEQLELLKLELEVERNRKNSLLSDREYIRGYAGDGQTTDNERDLIEQTDMANNRIKEISEILSYSTIVPNPNTEQIEIGSKFKAFVKFAEDDTEMIESTFIEKKVTKESSLSFTTSESPIGQAIHHKKLGESFEYSVNGQTIKGEILELEYYREGIGKTFKKAPRN